MDRLSSGGTKEGTAGGTFIQSVSANPRKGAFQTALFRTGPKTGGLESALP
jgi:hypothetical protein